MSDAEDVEFSLKVMINREKTKVLFAEADSHFTDILLSFLTLPLGRIVKVLEKHYGDEAPSIGSLNTLYHSLANLDRGHFWTEGAKLALLNPLSSFQAECERLKLDISDSSESAYYFHCRVCCCLKFRSVSVYYDHMNICEDCNCDSVGKVEDLGFEAAASDDGAFTKITTSFIISDDLCISSNAAGLLQTISILGITDMDSAKLINVSFGLREIMNLLKASFMSQTPLSDLILNKVSFGRSEVRLKSVSFGRSEIMNLLKAPFMSQTPPLDLILNCTSQMNSTTTTEKPKPETSSNHGEKEESSSSKKLILKIIVQKSTGKLLYAQAEEDFVELLFSFLIIPVGGVQCLLSGKACLKSVDNLYKSVIDLLDDKYFKTSDTKTRLIKPKLYHGYISKRHILPLAEECLPSSYDISLFLSTKFPKGQGIYLNGPITYHVTDDLTVTPFCFTRIVSSLGEQKILMSDVKEVEVQIGLEEVLNILKASLTSKFALTDGLVSQIST